MKKKGTTNRQIERSAFLVNAIGILMSEQLDRSLDKKK